MRNLVVLGFQLSEINIEAASNRIVTTKKEKKKQQQHIFDSALSDTKKYFLIKPILV
jgi:hypothetical protein